MLFLMLFHFFLLLAHQTSMLPFTFFFYSLLYSPAFLSAKYVLTTHCNTACASTAHSQVQMWLCCELHSYLFLFLLLLCISSILSIFMNTLIQMPIQQTPNTHMWLLKNHSGLLCTPPCLYEILGGVRYFPNILYYLCLCSQNFLYTLHSQGREILFCVMHCLIHFSLLLTTS
jgi:hypothetical protein